jgi:Flp pilus assembly protein TadD
MTLVAQIRRFSPTLPHYLFVGVFLLRIVSLERLSRSPLFLPARGDMHFYNDWAQRILRGELDLHTAFYGLPLYPYVLAFIYRIFGYSPFIPGFLQALIDSGTALLVYSLTLHLFRSDTRQGQASNGNTAGAVTEAKVFAGLAAAGWAFFVPAQAYSIILMPTAWFVFIFWFVVWRIATKRGSPTLIESLLLGLAIGFTAMAIATALFLIPLVVVAIWLRRGPPVARTICLKTALFLVGIGIGTSPCWIHNYVFARDPVLLSAHGGVNFWIGNNPTANGYPRFPPGLRAGQTAMLEDSITSAETAFARTLKRSEVSAYWSGKAWDYIRTHPGEWIRLLMIKGRNFWNAFQYDDLSIITNLREQGVIFPGLYFGLLAILALPGMAWAWRASPSSRWIIAAVLLHMAAVLTVFITERYRLPIVPGLTVMGAYGLWAFWRFVCAADYGRAAIYATVITGATIFISWPQRDPSLWALDAYNSGWQALESGNLPLAENKLTLAQRYVPTNPETNFALGNLRLAQGNKPEAASFYLATLKYEDTHRGALNNLAVIALEEHRYELAEGWLRRAESIDPRNAKTHYLLASALWASGSREAATTEIDTALQLRPGQMEFNRLKEKIEANSR